jgi:hypothetical protein
MPAVVRIEIHHDEARSSAMDDEIAFILPARDNGTEEAFVAVLLRALEGGDVLRPPGGEESFHGQRES